MHAKTKEKNYSIWSTRSDVISLLPIRVYLYNIQIVLTNNFGFVGDKI